MSLSQYKTSHCQLHLKTMLILGPTLYDVAVPENLFSPSTSGQQYNVSMALVNSSYDSATFAWSSLSPNSRTYVIGFFIQYRETTSEVWNQTVTLDPNTTRHTVTYLRASRPYKARLVALTKWASQPHMPLSMVMFTTKNNEGKYFFYS